MTDDDLPALIGSRICHDLTSPVGAVGNGVELLMVDTAPSPELELIADSVHAANVGIRFLRLAFGLASDAQRVSGQDLQKLVMEWSAQGRLNVLWRIDGDSSRRSARRALLALLCAQVALPHGGEVLVTRRGEEGWEFELSGPKVVFDQALWSYLSEASFAPKGLSASQVQFGLLRRELLTGPGLCWVRHGSEGLIFGWGDGKA